MMLPCRPTAAKDLLRPRLLSGESFLKLLELVEIDADQREEKQATLPVQ